MSAPGACAEVLVVDDSAVIRHIVRDVIEEAPGLKVSATASNGAAALDRMAEHLPDLVVLDIEMPVLDGLATLERIRSRWPDLPVVMFSTLTHRGATATLDALARGATDYVPKPSQLGGAEEAKAAVAATLVPVLHSCARVSRARQRLSSATSLRAGRDRLVDRPLRPLRPLRPVRPEALVVASSTGGPHALSEIVPRLPGDLPVPVLVVQHMPALFTRLLAERLDARSALSVREGEDGMVVEPSTVYIAPGGVHMSVRAGPAGRPVLVRDDGPPENSCKPSADVLFRAAAAFWGANLVGLVLTGMGHDGLAGSKMLVEQGGSVLVQDEATSVVWGMPGAVAREGLAQAELPLPEIADTLTRVLRPSFIARS
jgi:two-component system chemotaxis response regulator CheB